MASNKNFHLGLRALLKRKPEALLSVLVFGLGIGLITFMFSVVYGNFFRGLPFDGGDRIYRLERTNPGAGVERLGVGMFDFVFWQEKQNSFEGLAAWRAWAMDVSGGSVLPERLNGAAVSGGMFDLIGVHAIMGRGLPATDRDDPGAPIVLISHSLWSRRFGKAADIVGQTLNVWGEPHTILGVMPEGMRFPGNHDLWLPLRINPEIVTPEESPEVQAFGKLREGVSRQQALAELNTLTAQLGAEFPSTRRGIGVVMTPYTEGYANLEQRQYHVLLFAVVFAVVLICCASISGLQLIRSMARSKECAIRMSLGAGRRHVVQLILQETLALAVAGGILGVVLARIGIDIYLDEVGGWLGGYWKEVKIDIPVFCFAVAMTILVALLAGSIPALKIAAASENWLRQHGQTFTRPGAGKLARLLVTFQIAISVGLLAGMGLMIENLIRMRVDRFDFRAQGLLTGRISLFGVDHPDEESRRRGIREIENRLQALPVASGVALVYPALPGQPALKRRVAIEGEVYEFQESEPRVRLALVSPDFFEVFEKKPLAGRSFRESDGPNSEPVTIVNRSFSARYFSSKDPIGRQVQVGGVWRTVVGVVSDLAMEGIEDSDPSGLYVPLSQVTPSRASLVVATRGEPGAAAPQIRAALNELMPNQPLSDVMPMARVLARITREYRIARAIFVVLGIVSLILSGSALYGVLGYSVDLCVKEFAIRMALGAQARQVLWSVFSDAVSQTAAGICIGLLLFWYFSGFMESLLYRMHAWDLRALGASVVVLSAAGLLAAAVPAWRAVRTDPMSSLRHD